MQYCKSFLQVYVETSTHQRVLLDDGEETDGNTIKSSQDDAAQYLSSPALETLSS